MRWIVAGTHSLESTARVSTAHLVRYLAQVRGDEVLYLPAPVSPLHYVLKRRDLRFRERRVHTGKSPTRGSENVLQHTPVTLLPVLDRAPFDSPRILRASLRYTRPRLESVIAATGFARPHGIVISNLQYAWLDQLTPPSLLVYRAVDDIAGFENAPSSLLSGEHELLKRADAVFATSRDLARKLEARGAHEAVAIPNGVDMARFEAVAGWSRDEAEANAPADLKAVPRPRVVFCGTVNERVDTETVRQAASWLPEVRLVILGPWERDDDGLRDLPNVHALGAVAPDRVPRYLAACDAAMIPFRRSALVDATCPIKVFEYLAAGLPVVATRWPEMEALDAPVMLADSREEFVEALAHAIGAPGRGARVAYARGCDWNARFGEMMRVLGIPQSVTPRCGTT